MRFTATTLRPATSWSRSPAHSTTAETRVRRCRWSSPRSPSGPRPSAPTLAGWTTRPSSPGCTAATASRRSSAS